MPKVTYIEADGTEHQADVAIGDSIMQGAINKMIPGIEGDCGGLCACGTCHIYVSEQWATKCSAPDELEEGILEFAFGVDQRSRLSCQIAMSESLEGLVVHLPERQY